MQIYEYIIDQDIFNFIRNRTDGLESQKLAVIISHPTQKRDGEVKPVSKMAVEWSKTIPVIGNLNEPVTESTPVLHLERFDKI